MIGIGLNPGLASALSAFNNAQKAWNTSAERLATGKRINRAADDPSGLITANAMEAELRSITRNIDGRVYEEKRLGAIDGAQGALSDMLLDLNGLVVSSANRAGMSQAELDANQQQADSILQAIDYVAANTTFNGQSIIEYLSSQGLGLQDLASGRAQNLVEGDPEQAQAAVQAAIDSLATQRAGVGIREKDIQSEIRQLQEQFEAVSGAHSQIADADYAAETASLVRADVLRQAAIFVARIAMDQNASLIKTLLS